MLCANFYFNINDEQRAKRRLESCLDAYQWAILIWYRYEIIIPYCILLYCIRIVVLFSVLRCVLCLGLFDGQINSRFMTCDGRQNRSRISNLNGKLWFDYFGTILLPRESTVYAVGGEVVAFGCGCVCVYLWRMCVHFWVLKPLIWLCCRLQDETALRQDAENGLNAFRQVGFTTHNKVKVNYSPVRLYLLKQSRVFFSLLIRRRERT